VTIMAARAPDKPDPPTKNSADSTFVSIDWTAPYNGGTPLTDYKVLWNLGGGGLEFYTLFT